MRVSPILAALALVACEQPLDLPGDPAVAGSPVGVRTLSLGEQTVDVWYPTSGGPRSSELSLSTYLPAPFEDVLAPISLPTWTQSAEPDAPARRLRESLPVVIFSHGFGGFRTQSTQLTAHLASRGYVVLSTDHPGRDLATLVPCLLTVEGQPCDIGFPGGGGEDPATQQVLDMIDRLDELPDDLLNLIDPSVIGIFGHSAGGGTTANAANIDERILAALPMGGAGTFTRDLPSAVIGGSCDGIIPPDRLKPQGWTARSGYWSLDGAGHLAFSDLCLVDLGALADDLEELPEANRVFLNQLRNLATDGCPGVTPTVDDPTCDEGFASLEVSDPALRYLMTSFFDLTLKGEGNGPSADAYDIIRVPERPQD